MTGAETCTGSPYLIPRLYVEGMQSDEYLILLDSVARVSGSCTGGRCFGKAIYGVVLDDIVDIVAKRSVRSFIVVPPPDYKEGLLVEAGSHLEPIPVEGVRTSFEVCEGSEVKRDDTVAFASTRKQEVRRIISHVDGVVVYIYSSPVGGVERSIVFIAPKEVVRRVRIEQGSA